METTCFVSRTRFTPLDSTSETDSKGVSTRVKRATSKQMHGGVEGSPRRSIFEVKLWVASPSPWLNGDFHFVWRYIHNL